MGSWPCPCPRARAARPAASSLPGGATQAPHPSPWGKQRGPSLARSRCRSASTCHSIIPTGSHDIFPGRGSLSAGVRTAVLRSCIAECIAGPGPRQGRSREIAPPCRTFRTCNHMVAVATTRVLEFCRRACSRSLAGERARLPRAGDGASNKKAGKPMRDVYSARRARPLPRLRLLGALALARGRRRRRARLRSACSRGGRLGSALALLRRDHVRHGAAKDQRDATPREERQRSALEDLRRHHG